MKKKLGFAVMLVGLLVFVTIFAFAQNSPNVRWEYTGFYGNYKDQYSESIQKANQLGQQGWELVMESAVSDRFWVFKRRLP
jgi:hypothetical protein